MISWVNSWTSGIAASIVLGTIIEMLIPNGNNKKYIKVIIGLFVLFTIISPVIAKFSSMNVQKEVEKFMDEQTQINISESNISENTNKELEKLYKSNIEKDIKQKLKERGYDVVVYSLSISFIPETYGQISELSVKIKNNMKENTCIEKVEINIKDNSIKQEAFPENKKEEIKEFLSNEYGINREKIRIST